jgi:hypothetical protein
MLLARGDCAALGWDRVFSLGRFASEEGALTVDTPTVTARLTIGSNHAVAGDQHGDIVAGARSRDRARGTRMSNAFCHITIG